MRTGSYGVRERVARADLVLLSEVVAEAAARQAREVLVALDGRAAPIAGDFDAEPHDEAPRLLAESGLFAGAPDGPPTWPADLPRCRIDHVLAPRHWTLLRERVLPTDLSDHRPVVAGFSIREP